MPRATINPKVGMAKGPRCRKGIMGARASDSFESIHDSAKELGVADGQQLSECKTEHSFSIQRRDGSGTPVKDGAEEEPDGEGDPFRLSEVTGKGRDQLH